MKALNENIYKLTVNKKIDSKIIGNTIEQVKDLESQIRPSNKKIKNSTRQEVDPDIDLSEIPDLD